MTRTSPLSRNRKAPGRQASEGTSRGGWRRRACALALAFLPVAGGCSDRWDLSRWPWWCVARDGRCHVYLYPTLHVGRAAPGLPQPVVSALQSATLYVELDPNDPAARDEYMRLARQPEGSSLKSEISADTLARLRRLLRKNEGEDAELLGLRAWAIADAIALAHLAGNGFRTEHGIDAALIRTARNPPRSLEVLRDQLTAPSLPPPLAEKRLVLAMDSIERGRAVATAREMIAAGSRGDLDRLATAAGAGDDPELAAHHRQAMDRRDAAFVRTIEALAKDPEPSFVALGVLHFTGERGVLARLRERGLAVSAAPMGP